MAFPGDYKLLATIPINPAAVTGSNNAYTGLITEAAFKLLKSSIFADTDNGGGDVRFSTDLAGSNQIALDVVSWDTSGETCNVNWIADGVDDSSPTDLYIWGDNTGDSQPAVGAAFGRNAVWVDFEVVIHQGTIIDSTGNHTPVLNGSPSTQSMLWGGNGYELDDVSKFISIPHDTALNIEKNYYINTWVKYGAFGGSNVNPIVAKEDNGNSDGFWYFVLSDDLRTRHPDLSPSNLDIASNLINGTIYRLGADFDGTTRKTIVDGTYTSDTPTGTVTTTTNDLLIGKSNSSSSNFIDAVLGDTWIKKSSTGDDKRNTELSNQNDVAGFYLEPVSPASGITVTGTAIPTQTEADIVTGGKTIILTLAGDTFVTAGATFNAQRQAIIDGLVSAQSEVNGFNAERSNLPVTDCVRTSDTVVTITLSALASYDITSTETLTDTVPNAALTTGTSDIIGTPTFTITAVVSGFQVAWARSANVLLN